MNALPDLGVYLQPDPEHRASAMGSAGPQAYAYAGGRPLVNVDPRGRRFVHVDPAAMGALESVASLPSIGSLVHDVASDPDIEVSIYRRPSGAVPYGGRTIYSPSSFELNRNVRRRGVPTPPGSTCCSTATIEYNEFDYASAIWGVQPDLTVTTERDVIAHEIGHVWYYYSTDSLAEDQAHLEGMLWENISRNPGPLRTFVGPGAQ